MSSQRRMHALGLAELLISLAICAALLTATAVAMNASFDAYAINQEQAMLMQRSRLAMNRILTMIRTTDAHQPYTSADQTSFTAGSTVDDVGIEMLKDDGTEVQFYYDSTNQQLKYKEGASSAVLLNGVTEFQVHMEPMKSASSAKSGGNYDLLMRATILLTIRTTDNTTSTAESSGNQTVTLSSSVMPRRNVW